MPPTPDRNLSLTTRGQIDQRSRDTIRSFFEMEPVAAGIKVSGFTVQEEIETLVDIARNANKASDRIRALSQFRAVIREVAIANGVVQKGSVREVTDDGEGRTIERRVEGHRLTPDPFPDNEDFLTFHGRATGGSTAHGNEQRTVAADGGSGALPHRSDEPLEIDEGVYSELDRLGDEPDPG